MDGARWQRRHGLLANWCLTGLATPQTVWTHIHTSNSGLHVPHSHSVYTALEMSQRFLLLQWCLRKQKSSTPLAATLTSNATLLFTTFFCHAMLSTHHSAICHRGASEGGVTIESPHSAGQNQTLFWGQKNFKKHGRALATCPGLYSAPADRRDPELRTKRVCKVNE